MGGRGVDWTDPTKEQQRRQKQVWKDTLVKFGDKGLLGCRKTLVDRPPLRTVLESIVATTRGKSRCRTQVLKGRVEVYG